MSGLEGYISATKARVIQKVAVTLDDAFRQVQDDLVQLARVVEAGQWSSNEHHQRSSPAITPDLQRELENLEAASRAKSDFLASMSHEIRTPMTAILGFAEMLLDDREEIRPRAERRDALKTIKRNAEYLLQLMNDILDLSKIEAGKLEVELTEVPLPKLISDVVQLMLVRANDKQIRLDFSNSTPLPSVIQSDPLRLQQILINLLGNAIKFTSTGGVKLNVGCEQLSPESHRLTFEVIDTGIGMTPEQLSRLFQPFSQAEASTARKYGGSGLGLVISQRLAGLLGGGITVASEAGRGSVFTVTINPGPIQGVRQVQRLERISEKTGVLRVPTIGLAGRKILLAEDSPDNQLIMSRFLMQYGAIVTIVENGDLAITAALDALSDDEPFDVILMDMQMPVLDGFEATRVLRMQGYDRPIVALTAHAMAGDKEKCLSAGCTDYATKPINRQQLLEQLGRLCSGHIWNEQ